MFLVLLFFVAGASAGDYKLPDTGRHKCYDDAGNQITGPSPGERFYGQDARYQGAEPASRDNGDDTVSDLNTGLGNRMTVKIVADERMGHNAISTVGADSIRPAAATGAYPERRGCFPL